MSQPGRGGSCQCKPCQCDLTVPRGGRPAGWEGAYSGCEALEAVSVISLDHAPTEGAAVRPGSLRLGLSVSISSHLP